MCQSMKITVLPGKTIQGFTKVNPISDCRKLSGDAFANCIIISFQVFSETSPTFSEFLLCPYSSR